MGFRIIINYGLKINSLKVQMLSYFGIRLS